MAPTTLSQFAIIFILILTCSLGAVNATTPFLLGKMKSKKKTYSHSLSDHSLSSMFLWSVGLHNASNAKNPGLSPAIGIGKNEQSRINFDRNRPPHRSRSSTSLGDLELSAHHRKFNAVVMPAGSRDNADTTDEDSIGYGPLGNNINQSYAPLNLITSKEHQTKGSKYNKATDDNATLKHSRPSNLANHHRIPPYGHGSHHSLHKHSKSLNINFYKERSLFRKRRSVHKEERKRKGKKHYNDVNEPKLWSKDVTYTSDSNSGKREAVHTELRHSSKGDTSHLLNSHRSLDSTESRPVPGVYDTNTNQPQRETRDLVQDNEDHTFQSFTLSSRARQTHNNTGDTLGEDYREPRFRYHHRRGRVMGSSSGSPSKYVTEAASRRLRLRRWGQRTPSTSRREPLFGRTRSRSRSGTSLLGSRSRGGGRTGRPSSPSRVQAGPNAQLVSLKVIVEVRVDRGYDRILQSAIRQGIGRREFQPLLEFINPTGQLVRIRHDQPRDILKAFCSDILEANTTTVFQLINPFYHARSWSAAQYMASLLATLNIPVITWGPEYIGAPDKTSSDQTQLNISPSLHHQAEAMLDVLAYFHWSSFAIVYTPVPGYDTFLSAIRVLMKKPRHASDFRFGLLAEVKVSNVSDPTAILDDIEPLARTDARIILLYCKEGETLNILHEAEKLGLVAREYVWVLTFESLNKNKNQNANNFPLGLLGLQYTYREAAMREAIETAVSLWLRGLKQSMLSTSLISGRPTGLPWDVPDVQCDSPDQLYWNDGKKFYNFLKNVSYDEVSFNRVGQLDNAVISLYNVQSDVRDDTLKKWKQVGQWTGDGIQFQQITWPGGARTPPRGKPSRHYLRIVTREEPPFVIYRNLNSNGSCDAFSSPCSVYDRDLNETRLTNSTITKCCTGLSIDLLRQLSDALDFDFYLYEVEDFQWGSKTSTGEWDGIVGDVKSGRADMGVASMTIDADKSGAVNFSSPYMETGITFLVSIREGAISATAFLEPYDYPSWCLILVCSVHVTGASIFLFEWISPNGMDFGDKISEKHRFSLFRAFWLMWAMLFGAAVTTDSPRGVSSKFTSNIWALFALVFTASYTANLAAFMITKEEYYNLSGMQDRRLQNPKAVNPPFRFATVPNSTAESNIKKNNPGMYRYMKQYSQLSVDKAMEALKSQRLEAFIYDASVLKYQEGKDKDCQLITVGNWYATTSYGVALPPGSPWLARVNKVILELQYEGEMERLKDFWLAGACHNKRKKATNSRGIGNGVSSTELGIRNFTSAFIFLAAGTGLAAIVFIMEHFLFWLGRKKLSNWDKKDCCALISLNMGMTMSFRDSVREAMEAHKKAQAVKCKSPICETKLWKVNFELKQAKDEINKLNVTLLNLRTGANGRPHDKQLAICAKGDHLQGSHEAICHNNTGPRDIQDDVLYQRKSTPDMIQDSSSCQNTSSPEEMRDEFSYQNRNSPQESKEGFLRHDKSSQRGSRDGFPCQNLNSPQDGYQYNNRSSPPPEEAVWLKREAPQDNKDAICLNNRVHELKGHDLNGHSGKPGDLYQRKNEEDDDDDDEEASVLVTLL